MLKGNGLLSLWNGFDPSRREEYDLWHTRQHVAERLSVEGMLRVRRYDRGQGPLPEFLTLYELRSTSVLASPAYHRLMKNPSDWSRVMRPSFEGFFRVGHVVEETRGGGIGGALMVTTFDDLWGFSDAARREASEHLLSVTGATAVHMLARDAAVAPVPFAVAEEAVFPQAAAVMIESYGRQALEQATVKADEVLDGHGIGKDRLAWTSYDLAYLLDRQDLADVVSLDGPF